MLKSAVTHVGPLLVNRDWVDPSQFGDHEVIDAVEPNALRIGDTIIVADSRTAASLRGFNVRQLDVCELAKAEAGVTCCSLLVSGAARQA